MASPDLQWLLTKKSNAYIVKQQQVPLTFSREARNIAAVHQRKVCGHESCPDLRIQ